MSELHREHVHLNRCDQELDGPHRTYAGCRDAGHLSRSDGPIVETRTVECCRPDHTITTSHHLTRASSLTRKWVSWCDGVMGLTLSLHHTVNERDPVWLSPE